MGIIRKQAIQNAIYSYIGALIGFVSAGFLLPQLLNTEQNGLLKVLVSVSVLFSQFANVGFPNVITRFFPFFRDLEKRHYGFLFYPVMVTLAGSLLVTVAFFAAKDYIIAENIEKSPLLVDYIYYLLPLTFFTALFNILDTYARSTYNSVPGMFIKEFLQRVLIVAVLGLYFLDVVSFHGLVILYVVALCLPAFLMAWSIHKRGELLMRPDFSFVNRKLIKEMMLVSLLSILSSFSSTLISSIDSIMLNDMRGLSDTGVYAITFYFGTIIVIPARALQRISSTVLAESWKDNDLANIESVYRKSCLNQLLIGSLLFVGVWANIDNVLRILPPEYEAGRYVILLVSLANLTDMATGLNGLILVTSKYYKYDTFFIVLLVLITVLANLWLIPDYGITGAAMAALIAVFSYNLMRYLFLWVKYGMQPLSLRNLGVAAIALLAYGVSTFIPYLGHWLIDIPVRSAVITAIFATLVLKLKISAEVNEQVNKVLAKLPGLKKFRV